MASEVPMVNYNDTFNYMVYDTLSSSHYECNFGVMEKSHVIDVGSDLCTLLLPNSQFPAGHGRVRGNQKVNVRGEGRKKRRRRPKVCKNKDEAETQRMTHIAVERNRRKQMNEHLGVLRSLMPESYSPRGDQASIVGGAIQFVKELEHLVHSLEAQKMMVLQGARGNHDTSSSTATLTPPVCDAFLDPLHLVNEPGNKFSVKTRTDVADVEVTLIETHANLRIIANKNPRRLSKLVSGFQSLRLTILHLNVATFDSLVLYSISVKVEEGCHVTSVDSISEALHQMLSIIEEDVSSYFVNLLAA